jgi:phage-related protein
VGKDIATVEFGWPVGMQTCGSLGKGLWEVRSTITHGIARVIFFNDGDAMILVHGFTKKAQRTPKPDLDLALTRKKEFENGRE